MSKPDEITQDIWDKASRIYDHALYGGEAVHIALARAIMTAKAEAYEDAAKIAEAQEARIAELEKALKEAVGLLKDIDLGRSIHNSRKPDQNIDGPLWAQVPRIVELSRAALSKPQTQ